MSFGMQKLRIPYKVYEGSRLTKRSRAVFKFQTLALSQSPSISLSLRNGSFHKHLHELTLHGPTLVARHA